MTDMEIKIQEIHTLNQYQTAALEFDNIPSDMKRIYPALGIAGEAGEVADKVKKVIRDHNREFTQEICQAIALELGDVLWYVGVAAQHLGYTLEEIATMNISKLTSRQQRGVIGGSGDNR